MINVIGAGPVGLFSAYNLARRGHEVTVYDKKKQIGLPVHCTGIVTRELEQVLAIKKSIIINRFKNIRLHSKNSTLTARTEDILLDRRGFDAELASLAEAEGAQIKMETKPAKADKTVFADGPTSNGRLLLNPDARVEYYIGRQAICRGNFEKDTYEVHLGSIAPGFFGWIVPENEETARIGIACKRDTGKQFDEFIRRFEVKQIEQQGGMIPIYRNLKTQAHNNYLVGDAACQVKATTGGGLVPGLKAAKILAECIDKESNYHSTWRKELAPDLYLHFQLRKTLDTLSDKQYDRLLEILKGNQALRMSRDRPLQQVLSLLKSPKLLAFGFSAALQRLYARP
jgi:digeranylgeranylglycerophospholipid reductase